MTAGVGAAVLGGTGFLRTRPETKAHVIRHARSMLGTLISIQIHHPDTKLAEEALRDAFAAIDEVDRVMSIHQSNSDVSRVNAAAGRHAVTVAPILVAVLKTASHFHERTQGAYDVACLPLMRLFGFYPPPLKLRRGYVHHYPSDREIARVLEVSDQRWIEVDPARLQVGITKEGAAIDLGSIGKGFAADRAAAALRRHGVTRALIDIGGNLLALGTPEDADGWNVAIRNPQSSGDDDFLQTVTLKDQAIATSGNYEQSVILDERRVGHLFDMRSGHPSNELLSATVVARNATFADALSTSAYLLGEPGRSVIEGEADALFLF